MNNDVIDMPEFLERVQNDRELLVELLDIFCEDYLVKRKSLDASIAAENYEEVRGAAHSIKGASGNISAKKIHNSCKELEQLAKDNGDLNRIQAILKNIDQQFAEVQKEVVEIKKKS